MIAAIIILRDHRERTFAGPRAMRRGLAIRIATPPARGIQVPAWRPPSAHPVLCSSRSLTPTTACWCEEACSMGRPRGRARSIHVRRYTSASCDSRCQGALADRVDKPESVPQLRAAVVAPTAQVRCCADEWTSFGPSSRAPEPPGVFAEQCGTSRRLNVAEQPDPAQVRS